MFWVAKKLRNRSIVELFQTKQRKIFMYEFIAFQPHPFKFSIKNKINFSESTRKTVIQ